MTKPRIQRHRHRRCRRHPARRARRRRLLAERHRRAATRSATSTRSAGIPALYYDPDPKAPDKTYSKIGGWVRDWRVGPDGLEPADPAAGQRRDGRRPEVGGRRHAQALLDYGWPERPLDPERTAVVLGNAMAGRQHYLTTLRIMLPGVRARARRGAELRRAARRRARGDRRGAPGRASTPGCRRHHRGHDAGRARQLHRRPDRQPVQPPRAELRRRRRLRLRDGGDRTPPIEGLIEGEYDAVITGGIDRNMGAVHVRQVLQDRRALGAPARAPTPTAPTASSWARARPLFVLKRLADAERDGDRIYAVIRGIGGSSDGKGKGITAPNPIGQRLAVERAWRDAGARPATPAT